MKATARTLRTRPEPKPVEMPTEDEVLGTLIDFAAARAQREHPSRRR